MCHSRPLCPRRPGHNALLSRPTSATVAAFPSLAELAPSCLVSVNLQVLGEGETVTLRDSDEVALIPPVSGG